MDLKEFPSIDMSIPLRYCRGEYTKGPFDFYEFKVMAKTTFAGVAKRQGLGPGEEWKVLAATNRKDPEDMVAEMDEIGVEYCVMPALKVWSQHDYDLMMNYPEEEIAKLIKITNGRVIGGCGYNPFRIQESLEMLEKAVKEWGFKYAWHHPISFGLRPDDRKCYPLYAKCLELGIPCGYQSGHSAEVVTSEPGHPMYADRVAIDFPELTLVLTHTGWPWVDEWMSMLWRHPNVYGAINAYFPSAIEQSQVRFFDSIRGQKKVICGSHGFGMTRFKKEFLELPISDKTKKAVLYDNAKKVFKV